MTAIIPTALQTVSTQAHWQAPRREHPFYEGEYLDPEPVSQPARVRAPKAVSLQPHPFYEGEFLPAKDSLHGEPEKQWAPSKLALATEETDKKALQKHPFYEDEYLAPDDGARFFGNDGLNFLDILDVVNPLQHIPIISSLYRHATGDEISPFSRMAGGFLFGGPAGFAAAIANAVIEDATGKDIGETVIAMIIGDDIDTAAQVASISQTNGLALPLDDSATAVPSDNRGLQVPIVEKNLSADGSVTSDGPISLLPKEFETRSNGAKQTGKKESEKAPFGGMTATNLFIESDGRLSTGTSSPSMIGRSLFETAPSYNGGDASATNSKVAPASSTIGFKSAPMLQSAQSVDAQKSEKGSTLISKRTIEPDSSSEADEASTVIRASGKRGVPPTRNTEALTISVRRKPEAHVVPNSFIPKSMMDALTKYEALLKQQRSASSGLTL